MTGATGATALPVGALVAGTAASTGACAGPSASPPDTAAAGMTGAAAIGGATCGAGGAPCPIAFIAPCDKDCAGPATGCPVAIPVMSDWPSGPAERPWPVAAGAIGPLGIAGIPGATGAPLPGIGTPLPGDGTPAAWDGWPPAQNQRQPSPAGVHRRWSRRRPPGTAGTPPASRCQPCAGYRRTTVVGGSLVYRHHLPPHCVAISANRLILGRLPASDAERERRRY